MYNKSIIVEINNILDIKIKSEIDNDAVSKILNADKLINFSEETGESMRQYYINKLLRQKLNQQIMKNGFVKKKYSNLRSKL